MNPPNQMKTNQEIIEEFKLILEDIYRHRGRVETECVEWITEALKAKDEQFKWTLEKTIELYKDSEKSLKEQCRQEKIALVESVPMFCINGTVHEEIKKWKEVAKMIHQYCKNNHKSND